MDSPYLRGSVAESPVGLVLAESARGPNAMTVSFFSEVAHFPTTLWVSISPAAYTHALVEESGLFSLILLHEKQAAIAQRCGSVSGRAADKCAGLGLYRGQGGHLYMKDALVSVSCRVRSARPLGDHTLFIADILAGERESRHAIRRNLLTTDLA